MRTSWQSAEKRNSSISPRFLEITDRRHQKTKSKNLKFRFNIFIHSCQSNFGIFKVSAIQPDKYIEMTKVYVDSILNQGGLAVV